jgi:hypothetical protein
MRGSEGIKEVSWLRGALPAGNRGRSSPANGRKQLTLIAGALSQVKSACLVVIFPQPPLPSGYTCSRSVANPTVICYVLSYAYLSYQHLALDVHSSPGGELLNRYLSLSSSTSHSCGVFRTFAAMSKSWHLVQQYWALNATKVSSFDSYQRCSVGSLLLLLTATWLPDDATCCSILPFRWSIGTIDLLVAYMSLFRDWLRALLYDSNNCFDDICAAREQSNASPFLV